MPITLINIIILVTAIYSLLHYKELKNFGFPLICLIILINFFAELLAFYLNNVETKNGSIWVFNFSLPIELMLYGLIYKKVYKQPVLKKIINAFILVIPLISCISFILNRSIFPFHTYVFTFGCIFILFLALTFFVKLFIADYFLINPLKQFLFWLSTGLLLCYLGGFMYLSNLNFLFKELNPVFVSLKILNFYLNSFLYFCIIIAIRCLKVYPNSQIRSF